MGVEEQFYLFWPWLFKLQKRPLVAMGAVVVLFFVLRVGFHFSALYWLGGTSQKVAVALYNFLNYTRLDCMACGGLGAYFIYSESR